jgi:hypothetical protein
VPPYGAELIKQTRIFLQANHVDDVLWTPVGTYPTEVLKLFAAVLGPPSQVSGGVDAWYGVQTTLQEPQR